MAFKIALKTVIFDNYLKDFSMSQSVFFLIITWSNDPFKHTFVRHVKINVFLHIVSLLFAIASLIL